MGGERGEDQARPKEQAVRGLESAVGMPQPRCRVSPFPTYGAEQPGEVTMGIYTIYI